MRGARVPVVAPARRVERVGERARGRAEGDPRRRRRPRRGWPRGRRTSGRRRRWAGLPPAGLRRSRPQERREDRDRPLSPALGKVDRPGGDPARPQAGDVRRHRRGAPRRAVAQDEHGRPPPAAVPPREGSYPSAGGTPKNVSRSHCHGWSCSQWSTHSWTILGIHSSTSTSAELWPRSGAGTGARSGAR